MQKTLKILEETLYHIPMFAIEPRVRRFKKLPEYRLKKYKFTLSPFETSHPSIVVAFKTLFMLSTKAKFTLLFRKELRHNVRSYFKVTRVLVYTYTKNVTPGNKTLGSHLNSMRYCVLNFSYFRYISFIFISNK